MEDKLLYKHIILYVLLLLLPVVAFSGFMQISILEKIRQNYTYQLENRMIYCANDLEEVFSSLDTVRTNVTYSDDFVFSSDLSNVQEAKAALRGLQSFAINNPILQEIIFWYEGDEFAYLSIASTCRKDKLKELHPLFALKSVDDILEEEKRSHSETYLFLTFPEGTVPVKTICHTSVLINGRRALLIFLLKMPETDILDNLVVFDRQGNIQYSCNMDEGLRARKSWFFFEDRILCLGSGVEDDRERYETVTTLYQHWLGEETAGKNPAENALCGPEATGKKHENGMSVTKYPGDTSLRLRDPSGNEYIIPEGQQVIVTRGMQESRTQDAGEPAFARYEKAWICHGKAPCGAGYEYMIRIRSMESFKETERSKTTRTDDDGRNIYRILQKSASLHAVYDGETGIYAYVFFEAGSAPEGGGGAVQRADIPCMVMERRQGEELRISFCDPDLRLYEGQEPDQLDEDGNQKEVSLYSRTWLKNESVGKWGTVSLKGRWRLFGEKAGVRARIKGGETELAFWGKDGAELEVTLRRT